MPYIFYVQTLTKPRAFISVLYKTSIILVCDISIRFLVTKMGSNEVWILTISNSIKGNFRNKKPSKFFTALEFALVSIFFPPLNQVLHHLRTMGKVK